MTTIALWIFGILITIILGFIGYFLKENITVLHGLREAVDDIVVKFAVHEESNRNTLDKVDNLDDRTKFLERDHVELKLKINSHETILNNFKDGTYN